MIWEICVCVAGGLRARGQQQLPCRSTRSPARSHARHANSHQNSHKFSLLLLLLLAQIVFTQIASLSARSSRTELPLRAPIQSTGTVLYYCVSHVRRRLMMHHIPRSDGNATKCRKGSKVKVRQGSATRTRRFSPARLLNPARSLSILTPPPPTRFARRRQLRQRLETQTVLPS